MKARISGPFVFVVIIILKGYYQIKMERGVDLCMNLVEKVQFYEVLRITGIKKQIQGIRNGEWNG